MSRAQYFMDTDITTLVAQITQLPRAEDEQVLLFVAEHSKFDLNELLAALRPCAIPIAGGVFPSVIYGNERFETGIVVDVLPVLAEPSVVTGLDTSSFVLSSLPNLPNGQQYTALVLVDGLTKYVASFLDRLFRKYGNKVRYIGGGAGSLSFQQKPCLFDNHGTYQDAGLIVWVKATTSIGVQHGWKHLYGPFVANRTDRTIVHQLNSQPAFKVYSQLIKQKTGKTLTHENFFSIAKEYPLGIFQPGMDFIVRDPIAFTDDGCLVCVGEVPANSMVYILKGNMQSLVDHAQMATREALKEASNDAHILIVDCISRVLYLENEFSQELDAVRAELPNHQSPPFGVLTLGEIATFNSGRVEFFNKTFVVGALQELAPVELPTEKWEPKVFSSPVGNGLAVQCLD